MLPIKRAIFAKCGRWAPVGRSSPKLFRNRRALIRTGVRQSTIHKNLISLPKSFAAHRRLGSARHRSGDRSEEHTSELQSHSDLVCRLLLEKKKEKKHRSI